MVLSNACCGDLKQGEWKNDKRHGYGVCYFGVRGHYEAPPLSVTFHLLHVLGFKPFVDTFAQCLVCDENL